MILSLKFSLLTKQEEEEGAVKGQSSENKKAAEFWPRSSWGGRKEVDTLSLLLLNAGRSPGHPPHPALLGRVLYPGGWAVFGTEQVPVAAGHTERQTKEFQGLLRVSNTQHDQEGQGASKGAH